MVFFLQLSLLFTRRQLDRKQQYQWCSTHLQRQQKDLESSLGLLRLQCLLLAAESTHFVLGREHFQFTTVSSTPTFWNILVYSNVNFSTVLSEANSELLKIKSKQVLPVKGYRCSVVYLRLNSFSPAFFHIHKFRLCWTVSDHIKHYCIVDSTVTE